MTYAIIGSRDFNDYDLLVNILSNFQITKIVSGGARGADSLARRYANENNIELQEFLPDWNKYGKKAGFIRNKDIVINADYVIAFWDCLSKGTLSSINIAKQNNIKIKIVKYKEEDLF